ncbi:MAG TPA: MaoC family dehydratase N-terminal domain-containing protein [Acidimicrobiales bacterium]
MTLLTELKGQDLGETRVTIEAGPVRVFAEAVTDTGTSYRQPGATVPPTFPFVFPFWGSTGQGGAVGLPIDRLRGPGRMILHGEQAFTYHRDPRVGDTLVGRQTVLDVYEKPGDRADMHFYVTRTSWADASSGDPVVDVDFTLIVRITK